MRRFFIIFVFLTVLGSLNMSCEKNQPGKTILPTAPDNTATGTVSFKVLFAPWRNVFSAKIAGVESINKVTAYVYKYDDTEITNNNLTIESGRAQGSIDVTAQNNLKVVLVYFEEPIVRWIGEDTDVDVVAGEKTTAEIVEYFMGASVSAPDTACTGESYDILCMSLPYATGYQFQEAASSDFSDAVTVYSGADTTFTIAAKSETGTYYYRARAQTEYGYGPWYTTGDASTGIKVGEGTIIIDVPIPPDEPGTGKITFYSDRDGNNEIYVMDTDGSNQTRLTNNPDNDWGPSWSPDGSHIAFASERNSNLDVYIMDADGSNQIRLTNNPNYDFIPSWSPGSSHISFTSTRDGNRDIYVMDADGSNQTRLTDNSAIDEAPSWSPDGSKIAFDSDRDGNYEIYIMDADGSNQNRLTNNSDSDSYPSWSPDGSQIAFASIRDGNWEIYVMDADGSNQNRLTNNSEYEYSTSWSPDGSQIAFDSDRDGNYEIYIMDADGSNLTRLTNNLADDFNPSWSPF